MSDWNTQIIEEFRANHGHVGGRFENTPLLLLHTIGAKSGKTRINPVAYIKDGEQFVVVASKGGAPSNPDWYYNLLAHSEIKIEVGTDTLKVQAIPADEPERSRLYAQMVAKNPGFDTYRKNTTRKIPVILLKPVA